MSLSACSRTPLVVAHRGASHDAPENTLAAFRLALEQKADAIETDMRLTRDGRIVLLHDAGTKRTAGADHRVAETDAEVLRRLGIPFLEELLDLAPPAGFFLEIKCKEEILPPLEALLRKAPRNVTLIGFDLEVMAAAKARLPEVPVCWVQGARKDPATKKPLPHPAEWAEAAKGKGLDGLDVAHEGLTAEFAAAVRKAGLGLHVWTVDDPADIRRVADLGVDSITTNRPDLVRGVLHQSGR